MIGEQTAVAGRRRTGGERTAPRTHHKFAREIQRREYSAVHPIARGRWGPKWRLRQPGLATSSPGPLAAEASSPSTSSRWRPAAFQFARLADTLGRSVLVQLLLAMSFVALAALLYLLQASQASVLDVNIAQLQSDRAQLVAQNAALRTTATSLQSLQRVDDLATRQLHMARPDLSRTIWIRPLLPRMVQGGTLGADSGLSAGDPQGAEMPAAAQRSTPLGWMKRLIALVRASL